MRRFQIELEKIGVSDSRVYELARAAQEIHTAISAIDDDNRDLLLKAMPEFIFVARRYASFDDTLNADFPCGGAKANYEKTI